MGEWIAWRSVEVLAALFVSLLLVPPRLHRPSLHPVWWLYALVTRFSRKLNRPERGDRALRIRGTVLALFLLALGCGIGWWASAFSLSPRAAGMVEVPLLALLLAQRPVLAYRKQPWKVTQALWGYVTFRQPDEAVRDTHAKRRLAVEALVAYFSMQVLYVVFWFLPGGLLTLLPAYLLLILQAAVSGHSAGDRAFARVPRFLYLLASFIPLRLAKLLLLLAGLFVPGCRMGDGLTQARQFHQRHPLGRGGSLAVVAGMLGLALGAHSPVAIARGYDWLGDGRAKVEPLDTLRMWWLYLVAMLLLVLLLAVTAYLLAYGLR